MESCTEAISAGGSIFKRQKRRTRRKRDKGRISSLSDQVLCRILSFLPTKYAVVTSILSRRWRYLWTRVSSLYFDDRFVFHHEKFRKDSELKNSFVNFVDRALIHYPSQSIQKFYLRCARSYDFSRVKAWICAAILRNVVELHLGPWISMRGRVQLPQNLFSSETLTALHLHEGIVLNIPGSVYWPSLKVLHLISLQCLNDASLRKLISGSAVILRYNHDDVQTLNIQSCSLKSLTIHSAMDFTDRNYQCKVIVDVPGLEFLDLTDCVSEEMILIQFSVLAVAIINFDHFSDNCSKDFTHYADMVVQLLRQISNVKVLCLSERTLEVLNAASQIHLPCLFNLPTFHNLAYLEVSNGGNDRSMFFADMLDCAPKLEVLFFFNWIMWDPPESVPDCLLSSLEVVHFKSFYGTEGEMETVEYLLKNSVVLKKMTVSYPLDSGETEVIRKLLRFPRASSSCQIAFA